MANWTTRKTRTTKIGKGASYKSSTTFTYGKGITNSQSFGNKAGRTTFSTGPKGTKMYNTVRNGDMYMRTCKTISSNKTAKPKKIRFKKSKRKTSFGDMLMMFLIIGILLAFIL